ncbi:MAG: phosphohydrolase, partial [Ginsengibacter sp.]
MNYEILLKEAETFISKYMRKHENPKLLFHNLANTQSIVLVAGQIAGDYPLDEKELFIANTAAWFLYVGYYKDFLHP